MKSDQSKWDARYQHHQYPTLPSMILTEFCHLASPGYALDIATGNGRNAIYLAQNKFKVDAIDISNIGIKKSAIDPSKINFIHQDLDHFNLKQNHYNIVVNCKFLDRSLFPQISQSLKKKALLIFQTFLKPQDSIIKKNKSTKSHYLLPNELLDVFSELHIVYYSEHKTEIINGISFQIASLVAIKN